MAIKAIPGADPHKAALVFHDGMDPGMTYPPTIAGEMKNSLESAVFPVHQIQSVGGAHPEPAVTILKNGPDRIVAQTRLVTLNTAEGGEAFVLPVKPVESPTGGTDPQSPIRVQMKGKDKITGEGEGVFRIVPVRHKPARRRNPAVQPSAVGTDPDISVPVFQERPDVIVGKAAPV